jgi:polar amino acid transport system permease protein
VYRAGLEAVDPGQIDAAYALGLSRFTRLRYVVLPQAVRLMLAPLTNFTIMQIKATALASTIGVADLLGEATKAGLAAYQTMPFYLLAAACYFALCFPTSVVARRLERRTENARA